METLASHAAGTGGKPLGTEGLSVLPLPPQPAGPDGGSLFAREVTQALERSRGDGLRAKRLEELDGARRAERRASFGGPCAKADPAWTGGATPPPEPVSDAPQPMSPRAPVAEASPPALAVGPAAEQASSSTPASAAAAHPSGVDSGESAPGACPVPALPPADTTIPIARVAPERLVPAVASESHEVPPTELTAGARASSGRPVKPDKPSLHGPAASESLERAAEILRQIQLHATPWVKRLTLELEPAELGRLSIQLALRAGKLTAIVRGDEPETLELLRQNEGELARALTARGIRADAVRFEHGFSRPRRGPRGSSGMGRGTFPAQPAPSTPPRSASIDTYA